VIGFIKNRTRAFLISKGISKVLNKISGFNILNFLRVGIGGEGVGGTRGKNVSRVIEEMDHVTRKIDNALLSEVKRSYSCIRQ
jgi:hypothetical protein